jgi:hypothetical protein
MSVHKQKKYRGWIAGKWGGVSGCGQHLPGFGVLRIGRLTITLFSRWVRWPDGLRFTSAGNCYTARLPFLVVSWFHSPA